MRKNKWKYRRLHCEKMKQESKVIRKNADRVELWKQSEEGQYMKKHCLRQYYDTIQEIERRK